MNRAGLPVHRRTVLVGVGGTLALAAGGGVLVRLGRDAPRDLATVRRAEFTAALGTRFRLSSASGDRLLRLAAVDDLDQASTDPELGYALTFDGDGPALSQDTYALRHADLGTIGLFLVPDGGAHTSTARYAAVVNRLPERSRGR